MPLPYLERKKGKLYRINIDTQQYEEVPIVFKYRMYNNTTDRRFILGGTLVMEKRQSAILTSTLKIKIKANDKIVTEEGSALIVSSVPTLEMSYTVFTRNHPQIAVLGS